MLINLKKAFINESLFYFYGMTNVYIDESGDLGWVFDKPNREGGSSRYLTIAFVTVPEHQKRQLWRLVKKVYEKYNLNPKVEKKGSSFTDLHASYIAGRIVDLVNKQSDINICATTIKKEKVVDHIREDENLIYNYALGKKIGPVIKDLQNVTIIPDKRTIKVNSGNSFPEYLKILLWFEMKSKAKLNYTPNESTNNPHLWFIDWISNFVWRKYEDGREDAYNKLKEVLDETRMFF